MKTGWLVTAAALVCAAPSMAEESASAVLFDDVAVFDGDRAIGTRDVLIDDGRIVKVARRIALPAGAQRIDGRGKTLLPGLIDAHVHLSPGGPADALRFGVTSVWDMYNWPDAPGIVDRVAHRQSLARTDTADVWSSGFGITPPGGHPFELFRDMPPDVPAPPALAPEADAAAFAAARVAEGSDYIKVIQDDAKRPGRAASLPAFAPERFRQVMAGAKATGRRVFVHVQQLADAREAVATGADALAHAVEDEVPDAALLRQMKRRKVALIGTISVYDGIEGGRGGVERLLADPEVARWLSPMQKITMGMKVGKADPAAMAVVVENVRRAHRAGVTILAGSDAPNPTTGQGASMHLELEQLVKAGLSPAQSLRAATASPADFLALAERGRIAVGKRADLLLVEGNPVRDITATRRIAGIWKNGFPVDRTPPTRLPWEQAEPANPVK